jgi:sensor histidine kinase YesM
MERINDKWIRIGGIAFLLLNLFITGYSDNPRSVFEEIVYVALYLVSVTIILETGRYLILSLHKKYPAFAQSKRRFWTTVLYVFLSYAVLIPVTFNIFHWLRGMHAGNQPVFFVLSAVSGFILAILQTGIYESFYNFSRLRKLEQEHEELLRLNIQSQFDSLKQQVNPHFLFNSINTVSSLISIDPVRAKKFLAEMSKVYRYLLRASEEELTTLEKELTFLHSYFHLLKTRFGEGLHLQLNVDDESRPLLLPVLSLQLLIENAVKHNTIADEQPLVIIIETTSDNQLCVKNNLQKKLNAVDSNKVGLSTITAKYRLLNQHEPIIRESTDEFIVILQLIQTNVYERIDR